MTTGPGGASWRARLRHRLACGARSRRARRRWGRMRGVAVLLLPAIWILGVELLRRGRLLVRLDRLHFVGWVASLVGSAFFWAILLYGASRRRGRVARLCAGLFAVLFVLALGTQAGIHALYRCYIGMDALKHAGALLRGLVADLPLGRPIVALHFLLSALVAVACLALGRRYVRPGRRGRRLGPWLVPVALAAVMCTPVSYYHVQSSTPDLIYFHGERAMLAEHLGLTHHNALARVQRRFPDRVPELRAIPARPRNVLLVVQEAQRADVTCIEPVPSCRRATPASNAAAPQRLPLLQMRSNSSSTAISLAVLWTGMAPTESFAEMHSAPLVWELARAAGYHIAYWTSQHLMFANSRLYVQDVPFDESVSATELDPWANMFAGAADGRLGDYVIDHWAGLEEPFFAVVQYSNGHAPRLVDPSHAPFAPYDAGAKNSQLQWQNYYRNVMYLSDLGLGRLLAHLRTTPSGQRTVIVFTADHAESFHRHSRSCDHACTLFDDEVHVPAWIDAPPGTLSEAERAAVRRKRRAFLTHLDLAATLFDLLGIWDAAELARWRPRYLGRPVTRPELASEPAPLTNVSWVWEYRMPNWGLMQGSRKLFALHHDRRFRCFDLAADPHENVDLGEDGCPDLVAAAQRLYGGIPRGAPTLAQAGGFAGRPSEPLPRPRRPPPAPPPRPR